MKPMLLRLLLPSVLAVSILAPVATAAGLPQVMVVPWLPLPLPEPDPLPLPIREGFCRPDLACGPLDAEGGSHGGVICAQPWPWSLRCGLQHGALGHVAP